MEGPASGDDEDDQTARGDDDEERNKVDALDKDAQLLSSLGVTAAKPEDIERDVIAAVEQKARETRKSATDARHDEEIQSDHVDDESDPFHREAQILNRLKALDQEIDAVAAGLESLRQVEAEEEDAKEGGDEEIKQLGALREGKDHLGVDGSDLQRALAKERLKSLRRKRRLLREQLEAHDFDQNEDEGDRNEDDGDLLHDIVRGKDHEVASSLAGKRTRNKKEKPRSHDKKGVSFLDDEDFDSTLDAASSLVETERDRLVRTGVLTPFDRLKGFERRVQRTPSSASNQNRAESSIANVVASLSALAKSRPSTKLMDASQLPKMAPPTREFQRLRRIHKTGARDKSEKPSKDQGTKEKKRRRPMPEMKWRKRHRFQSDDEISSNEDQEEENMSGDEGDGLRESTCIPTPNLLGEQVGSESHDEGNVKGSEDQANTSEDVLLEGGLRIPSNIYDRLFDYQKTGVKWLWELHCQRAGGIIGDEMGLGKTIQVVAFLAALHHSGLYKPSIVICPATLLRQWKREVRNWYGLFDVEILHDSAISHSKRAPKAKGGKAKGGSGGEVEGEEDGEEEESEEDNKTLVFKGLSRWNALIERIVQHESGLLVTTYEQLRIVREKLLDIQWGYAVLDEGHRIRNPDAGITLVCKQLQTVHRIIMTGAPIQNRLTELWSLFDFVFPGKLGVLPVFQAQFALPIAIGGYANATPLQVSTAYKCAVVLRDLIMPYLLRRLKSDVNAQLPKKTEQVLFCSLTEEQRSAYRAFLASSDVEQIFEGNRNSLYGIDILRKICNHPDLLDREHSANHPDYGNPERSGKLKVVTQILDLWKNQGHRVLLFSQTQQMLDILENYMIAKDYTYRRMDGSTPIKLRMALVDEFNESTHVFAFILTTKVGGLGTNLTGGNRVIIFDPDWNPSTDMQARERAWRIGQTRDVTIYRLITRGTIEEKVYHRQIYKHFLTNKILRDPQQQRFFKARDMRDLFTLQDDKHDVRTETSALFAEVTGEIDLSKQVTAPQSSKEVSRSQKTQVKVEEESFLSKGKGKEDPADDEPKEDESRILKCLFEANGIHSALDHHAIESMNNLEKMKVDKESARVAEQAAEALRQSRMLRCSDNVAVPTWTGRSGAAGAPVAVRRRFGSTISSRLTSSSSTSSLGSDGRPGTESGGGASSSTGVVAGLAGSSVGKALSSSDVLARIREGRVGAGIDSARFHSNNSGIPDGQRAGGRPGIQPEILIRQLCTFIEHNGGSVSSSHVVEKFRDVVPAHDVSVFRQLLKEIAILRKGVGAEARWVLKDEYRSDGQG